MTLSTCLPPGLVDLCIEHDGKAAFEIGDIGCKATPALTAPAPVSRSPEFVSGSAPPGGCTDISVGGVSLTGAAPSAAQNALSEALGDGLDVNLQLPSVPDLKRSEPPPEARSGTRATPPEVVVLRL
jgi:hypothetical protein